MFHLLHSKLFSFALIAICLKLWGNTFAYQFPGRGNVKRIPSITCTRAATSDNDKIGIGLLDFQESFTLVFLDDIKESNNSSVEEGSKSSVTTKTVFEEMTRELRPLESSWQQKESEIPNMANEDYEKNKLLSVFGNQNVYAFAVVFVSLAISAILYIVGHPSSPQPALDS